jgi:tRNA (guanine37-N1)-methyltransferase
MWTANILTLFPEIFPGMLAHSVVGNALSDKLWELNVRNIRDYAKDKHKTVDDPPFGGGGGMVMRPDVLGCAIEDFFVPNGRPIIYLSPRGKLLNQQVASEIASSSGINILCGRFEGIDERVINEYNISELSIGDYVLSSGDVAAVVLLDVCVRFIEGVLDHDRVSREESFGHGEFSSLLEYPHYTRPRCWKQREVPEVLVSGDHRQITSWRLEQSKLRTMCTRKDIWKQYLKYVKKMEDDK